MIIKLVFNVNKVAKSIIYIFRSHKRQIIPHSKISGYDSEPSRVTITNAIFLKIFWIIEIIGGYTVRHYSSLGTQRLFQVFPRWAQTSSPFRKGTFPFIKNVR